MYICLDMYMYHNNNYSDQEEIKETTIQYERLY